MNNRITITVRVKDNKLSDDELLANSSSIATQIKRLGLTTVKLKDHRFKWVGVFTNTHHQPKELVQEYLNMVNPTLFKINVKEEPVAN